MSKKYHEQGPGYKSRILLKKLDAQLIIKTFRRQRLY